MAAVGERTEWHTKVSDAFSTEYDPFNTVDACIEWTLDRFPPDSLESGLIELLEWVTRHCLDSPRLRDSIPALDLWIQFAAQADKPELVYQFLRDKGVGIEYAPLYVEYANVLERAGRRDEAKAVYTLGLQSEAKPIVVLQKSYMGFRTRPPQAPPASSSSPERSNGTTKAHALRRNPLMNHPGYALPIPNPPSTTLSSSTVRPPPSQSKTSSSRPAKRRELLQLDVKLLLFDGREYCNHEARARFMGLLGKKWPPLPTAMPVRFNDEGRTPAKVRRIVESDGDDTMMMDRSFDAMGGGEPTMTMNTKEAMADVFGMYNSPDKTMKLAPGSKHAPTRMVEPMTPALKLPDAFSQTPATFRPLADENAKTPATFRFGENSKTPASAFKPFMDENSSSRTPAPKAAFTPFRDVFTANPTRETHSPTPSSREPIPVLQPSENVRTPFRGVFSLPSGGENAVAPAPAFTPFVDPEDSGPLLLAVTAPRSSDDSLDHTWSPPRHPLADQQQPQYPEDEEEYEEEYSEQMLDHIPDIEHHDQGDGYDDEGGSYSAEEEEGGLGQPELPLRGRFGQFNVMTPITERTFELTTSSRGTATPIGHVGMLFLEHDAHEAAGRLAEELQEERDLSLANYHRHAPSYSTEDSEPSSMMTDRHGSLSLLDTLTRSSSFRPENPCNAFDPAVMDTLLALVPVDPRFHDFKNEDAGILEPLEKHIKRTRKTSGNSTMTGVLNIARYPIAIGGRRFLIEDKLGEGGFGAVFTAKESIARSSEGSEDEEDEDDDDEGNGPRLFAIKVVRPKNLWEYHVIRRVHTALPPSVQQSVVTAHALYAYRDESFLLLDHCSQGTLLSLVNTAATIGVSQQGGSLHELLVMFFAIELLRLVECMHREGLIHGDLKADNCLLRLDDVPGGATAWSNDYSPIGEGGWSCKGVKVIDFGRTIDTRMFPPNQTFIADWPADARDCLEIRENKPWTYHNDYFGIAGTIHCMLFGKYIDNAYAAVGAESPQRYRLTTPLKRYWQDDLWTRLFDLLLNPALGREDGALPLCDEVGAVREEMEIWLQANCNRASGSLKGLLKKVERATV